MALLHFGCPVGGCVDFFHFLVIMDNVYNEYYRKCMKYYTLYHILDDFKVMYRLIQSKKK